jgi:hypothetical protein
MWNRSIMRRSGSGPSVPLGGSDKTVKITAAINARDKRTAPQSARFPLWTSSFLSGKLHPRTTFCCRQRRRCGSRRPALQCLQDLPKSFFDVPRIGLLDRGAFEAVRARRGESRRHSFEREADSPFGAIQLDIDPPPPRHHNPENRLLKNTGDRQCARHQQSYPYRHVRPGIRRAGGGPYHLILCVDVLQRACATCLAPAGAGRLLRIWPLHNGGCSLARSLRDSLIARLRGRVGRGRRT